MDSPSHRKPSLPRRLGEILAIKEPLRLAVQLPRLLALVSANPKTTVVLPGLGANDLSTLPMRRFLARIGHRPHGWGLGIHPPDLRHTLRDFLPKAEAIADRAGQPLALIGWSLGGIVARETARERPDLVSCVISYGSPLMGPRHTSASTLYGEMDIQQIETLILESRRRPIQRPVTAIYSRADGVVDWTTCIDRDTPNADNVEVRSTHIGMGLDPDVWRIIAQALERSP